MLLKTQDMHERLIKGGFTDQQADALIVVIEELAEVFVTKDYLEAELAKSRRKQTVQILLGTVGIVSALNALFLWIASALL